MARRSFDGRKIFNEPWDNVTRLALIWLLSNADAYGLQKESPGALSDALRVSKKAATDCLDRFIEDKVIIRWSENGSSYLAFRKWQDYQKITYAGRISCPTPPQEVYDELSENTQKFFCENFGNVYKNCHINSDRNLYSQESIVNSQESEVPEGGGVGEPSVTCLVQQSEAVWRDGYSKAAGVDPPKCKGYEYANLTRLVKERKCEVPAVIAFIVGGEFFKANPASLGKIITPAWYTKALADKSKPAAPVRSAWPDPASCTAEQAYQYQNQMRKDGRTKEVPAAVWDKLTAKAREMKRLP